MADFREITPQEIAENPFKLIGGDWALVTAGDRERFNTMTISWGGMGIMWNKPVVFSFIRPQRYTFEFTEQNDRFTMSFFDEEYRKALAFCGSKSGRDVDKVKETGLTPAFTEDGVPYFEEAKLVLVCKKLYAQDLNAQSITDQAVVSPNYNGNDYHKMYVSEIVKALTV
ncbi:MAG: flavin reductase family protein [Ruminococcus sp.]|nr:flavin reductase family protein [Ruminococcus sp.]